MEKNQPIIGPNIGPNQQRVRSEKKEMPKIRAARGDTRGATAKAMGENPDPDPEEEREEEIGTELLEMALADENFFLAAKIFAEMRRANPELAPPQNFIELARKKIRGERWENSLDLMKEALKKTGITFDQKTWEDFGDEHLKRKNFILAAYCYRKAESTKAGEAMREAEETSNSFIFMVLPTIKEGRGTNPTREEAIKFAERMKREFKEILEKKRQGRLLPKICEAKDALGYGNGSAADHEWIVYAYLTRDEDGEFKLCGREEGRDMMTTPAIFENAKSAAKKCTEDPEVWKRANETSPS